MARDKTVTGDGKGNKAAAAQNTSEGAGNNNKKGSYTTCSRPARVFPRFLTDNAGVRARRWVRGQHRDMVDRPAGQVCSSEAAKWPENGHIIESLGSQPHYVMR